MRERQRPRQVSNRGLHGAREIPCKPPLGARNQKSRDQGTGSGSKNDQCLLRTWPLERLAFQSPHLPHPFHPATGSYCTGCSRRQNRMPGNPDCLPAPSPPSRPAAAQFVCRGLHTRIGLPFFFLFSFPVSSAVSRNSPPVELLPLLLLFLELPFVCLAELGLWGCVMIIIRGPYITASCKHFADSP